MRDGDLEDLRLFLSRLKWRQRAHCESGMSRSRGDVRPPQYAGWWWSGSHGLARGIYGEVRHFLDVRGGRDIPARALRATRLALLLIGFDVDHVTASRLLGISVATVERDAMLLREVLGKDFYDWLEFRRRPAVPLAEVAA